MSRPSEEQRVRKAVADFLATAEQQTAAECPISISAIRRATGISRTTLTKYDFSTAMDAAREKQRSSPATSAATAEKDAYADRLLSLRQEIALLEARNAALVERMQLIEGNIGRLGLDPEELYRPLQKPARQRAKTRGRTSPAAGKSRRTQS